MFVERVLDHWNVGQGAKFNPMRKTALRDLRTAKDLPSALREWGYPEAKTIATHAKNLSNLKNFSFSDFKETLETSEEAYCLVFGTGFGLTNEFMAGCYGLLEPIKGSSLDDYRHLSVRSAVSICLDRLLGS